METCDFCGYISIDSLLNAYEVNGELVHLCPDCSKGEKEAAANEPQKTGSKI